MSSRRKRAQRQNHQTQNKGQKTQPWPRITDEPLPVSPKDASRVSISDALEPEPDAKTASQWWEPQAADPATGYAKSRFNSMRDGLRSTLIHPEETQRAIDQNMIEFTRVHHPKNTMELYFVWEIARTTVQIKICDKQVIINEARVLERVRTSWHVDQGERAERLMKRLQDDPLRVARGLERTKQGAELLVFHWTALREAASSNGRIDEDQRSLMFDLRGIPVVLRNGSLKVPEATNGPALIELADRELGRLGDLIKRELEPRDEADRQAALLGITAYQDAASRKVKNAESRHQKRLEWAIESLKRLQMGVPASEIIDPKTKKCVDPGDFVPPSARSRPASEPAQAAAPPSSSAPEQDAAAAATAPAPAEEALPHIPEGCPTEMAELMHLAFATLRLRMEEAAAAQAALDTPPDEPGPPSA